MLVCPIDEGRSRGRRVLLSGANAFVYGLWALQPSERDVSSYPEGWRDRPWEALATFRGRWKAQGLV